MNISRKSRVAILLLIPLLIYQCSDKGSPVQNGTDTELVSYSMEVQPIFDVNCVFCHGPEFSNAALLLNTYDHIMAGTSDNGPVVIPGNSTGSLIVQKLQGFASVGSPLMPPDGPVLSLEEIQTIIQWIDEGAMNTE